MHIVSKINEKAATISRYSAERDIGQWKWETTSEERFTNSTQYSALKSDFSNTVHWITQNINFANNTVYS
jgi:hypothetical protein